MKQVPFTSPDGSPEALEQIIQASAAKFPRNLLLQRVDSGKCTMEDYHQILRMIFHQTYNGPAYLALAGSCCGPEHQVARDYLIHHADEEKSHWQWVLNDLEKTGYKGPDPRSEFPPVACQAYLSFNYHVASKMPLGRLAIALMLETLGATCGKQYAVKFTKTLKLTPDQAMFFFGHGDTDVGHTKEIWEVVSKCKLGPTEWGWMCFAAQTAFELYYRMYVDAANTATIQESQWNAA